MGKVGEINFGGEIFQSFENLDKVSAWIRHLPFMAWLISVHRPATFVELGTHWGTSFLGACQTASLLDLNMNSYAVDVWTGDEHAGFYEDNVYEHVLQATSKFPKATLMRSTFDEARTSFEANTIDLLHIDGLHTFEAVKHDFETWLPAMSEKGVVIFHDIAERRDDFGVYLLWDEVSRKYPHFHFDHGHGLGVLKVGTFDSPAVDALLASESTAAGQQTRQFFQSLGDSLELPKIEQALLETHTNLVETDAALIRDRAVLAKTTQERDQLLLEIDSIRGSTSWRLTSPLRSVKKRFLK